MRCLSILSFCPPQILKCFKNVLLPLLLSSCIFVPTLYAEPVPDGFGLTINCIDTVYEKISEAIGLDKQWGLVIRPDLIHKACIKGHKIYISYEFVKTLHSIDELALIIGHEAAHIRLGHIICNKSTNYKTEAEADYWGYRYARLAGYDPDVCKLLSRNHFPERRINYLKLLLAKR